jgi:hypothetical protein
MHWSFLRDFYNYCTEKKVDSAQFCSYDFFWRCWSKVYVTNVKGLFPVLVAQNCSKWRPAKKSTVNNLLCNTASIVEQNEIRMDNREYHFNTLNAELYPMWHLLALLGSQHILHVSRIRVKRNIVACNFRNTCYSVTRLAVPFSLICEPVKVNFFF